MKLCILFPLITFLPFVLLKGADGTQQRLGSPTRRMVQQNSTELELVYRGAPDSVPEIYPIGQCEGECSDNTDCRGLLQCKNRGNIESVPGCNGNGEPGTSYCYDPRDGSLTSLTLADEPKRLRFKQTQETNEKFLRQTAPVINYIGEDGPFGLCEGDCDGDDDCTDGLECFSRDEFEPVPGCSGEGGVTDTREGADICHDPSTLAPSAPPSMNLGKCEGGCGEDKDCRGELRCQKRGGTEFVPGCDGVGEPGVNYCYDQNDGIAPPMMPAMPSGSHRLRLYWEQGYYWQETYDEFFYCMQYNGVGNRPTVRTCKSSSTQFEFVYLPGQGDQIKASGTNHCIDHTGNVAVTFQDCDVNNRHQRWMGNWASRRFDIRSVSRENNGCLTQHHHPKSSEEVFINPCFEAHLTDTGYWNLY